MNRSARRVWWAALIAAVLLVAGLPLLPNQAGAASGPSLPAEFATYSRFTANAADQPAGRAIAVYEYGSSELFTTWQTLAVGADRDTYRTIDRSDLPAAGETPVLLSPDGTQLLYFRASRWTDEFRLFDLRTGRTTVRHSVEWTSNVGASISLLAWSPDGRYVAYAVPAPPPTDGRAESSFVDGEPIRHLAILDVVNDTTRRYANLGPIFMATFAPDSRRLAVQTGVESLIVGLDGRRIGTWTAPPGMSTGARMAWSPDGSLLAVALIPTPRPDGSTSSADTQVAFVDMTGTGRSVPAPVQAWIVLGWRSDTEVVTQQWLADEGADAVVGLSTVDGSRTVLSRFPTGPDCEYGLRTCQAFRIQLATSLLTEAGHRPGQPDRGSWVPIIHSGVLLLAATTAGLLLWLLAALGRRQARTLAT